MQQTKEVTSRADKINARMAFVPPEKDDQSRPGGDIGCCDGIPYPDNISWMRQWYPEARLGAIYLIVCVNEDSPAEIWEMETNRWDGECRRVWRDPELDEGKV